jgi:uncharacterized protein (UPF0371 family)
MQKEQMQKIGFDTEKYLEEQKRKILERVNRFEKLYLEFGGKLCYDMHAARVLPGYKPTAKIGLGRLKDLAGCEMHITHMPKYGDENGLMRLKLNMTTDAKLSLLSHFQ